MLEKIQNFINKNKHKNSVTTNDKINILFESLDTDIILIKIGSDLVNYGELICRIISHIREEIKDECGFIMPCVKVIDSSFLQENEFKIYIKGHLISTHFVIPNEKGISDEMYNTIKSTVYKHLNCVFTNEIVEKYIDTVQKNNDRLIWNLTNCISVIDIKTILVGIINCGKSINNITNIFEEIGNEILINRNKLIKEINFDKIANNIAKKI